MSRSYTPLEISRKSARLMIALPLLSLTCLGEVVAAEAEAQRDSRPNVVLIITDDQRIEEVGAYGGKVYTPNLDRLAHEGIRFTNAYTAHTVCTPSRYAMFTGRYASRCTHPGFLRRNPLGATARPDNRTVVLEEDRPNLMKALSAHGYVSGISGKWHLGEWMAGYEVDGEWRHVQDYFDLGLRAYPQDAPMDDPELNSALGFNQGIYTREIQKVGWDEAMSIVFANPREFHHDVLSNTHNQEWITYGAVEFIRRHKDRSFFLTMAATIPHLPDPDLTLSENVDPRITGEGLTDKHLGVQPSRETLKERVEEAGFDPATAYLTWFDDGVGAILATLEELGLEENTVIIFTSDHGLDGKASLYEDGVAVPMMIYWKGKIEPRVEDRLVQTVDFTPTILGLTGAEALPDMILDGKDWTPMLFDKNVQWREDVYFEKGYARGVRSGKWKYIAVRYPEEDLRKFEAGEIDQLPTYGRHKGLGQLQADRRPNYYDFDQLYNLEEDPTEQVNLANDPNYSEVLQEMKVRMQEYLKTFPDRPFGELYPHGKSRT